LVISHLVVDNFIFMLCVSDKQRSWCALGSILCCWGRNTKESMITSLVLLHHTFVFAC